MPPHTAPRGNAAGRITVLTLVTTVLLAGCAAWDPISDPPPDPEVQPIEVVVNSDSRPKTPCLLNVDEVHAGSHEVSIVGVSGFARVNIVDENARVVFRMDNAGQRIETNDAGEVTTIHGAEGEGAGPPARLEPGTFTVQCRPENGVAGEATLRVLPARAGHASPSVAP
jgi:hypothetical protein